MDLQNILERRFSCKDFSNQQVEEKSLMRIIQAGNMSPVGRGDYSKFHFSIIRSKELIDMIDRAAAELYHDPNSTPLYGSQTLIVVSVKDMDERSRITYACTAGCMIENMILMGVEEKVDSVCMTGITRAIMKNPQISEKMELPEEYTPLIVLALGYSKSEKKVARTFGENNITYSII